MEANPEETRLLQRIRGCAAACFAALLAISCSRSPPAPVTAIPEGMVMHRTGAGDPDASGWCLATSTEGGFSVSLPNVFNDFTMTSKAVDGVEIKIFVVGTLDERRVKFSGMAIRRADGAFKEDPLEGIVEKFEKGGDLKEKRPIALGDMKGIELRVANRSSSAAMRLYKAPTMLYQLILEAPGSVRPEEIEADGKRFLESLDVTASARE